MTSEMRNPADAGKTPSPDTEVAPGWTVAQVEAAADEEVIERFRYASEEDRVLARYEEVDTYFPGYDELKARGVDVKLMAYFLQHGNADVEDLGRIIASQPVSFVNTVLASVLRNT